ncbi:MAG: B12-binding domain-containing radical SAM protein, partial [Candidatus Hodarchaeales archaeon]
SGVFLTARGCPFRCTYCSCDSLAKLYEEKITRFRDVDDIISEVFTITSIYEMDMVWFTDETFTVNKKRTIELCKKYKDTISVPFSVETRPDTVNEEVLVALKEAGCVTIRMGIESGVDRIRNGLYKRNMSREKILDAFHTAKKVGLKTTSYNIIGAPTETIRDIRATISLNVECGVESGKMTLLSVFPGTRMWDYCKENGYEIRESYPENYYIDSNITHETLSVDQLIDLRHEFNQVLYEEKPAT